MDTELLEDGLYVIETNYNLSGDARRCVNECQNIQSYVMRKYLEDIPRIHPQYERLCMEAMHRALDDPAYRRASQILSDVYLMNSNTTITLRRLDVEEGEETSIQEVQQGAEQRTAH